MKRVLLVLFIIIMVMPIRVNANIVCNDGTVSPSCSSCHRGCCSRHGGCSSRNSSESSIEDESTTTTKTKKVITTTTAISQNNDDKDGIWETLATLGVGALIGGVTIAVKNNRR